MNECHKNLDKCAVNAVCIDNSTGYTCVCKPGYLGDGYKQCTVTLVEGGGGDRSGVKLGVGLKLGGV